VFPYARKKLRGSDSAGSAMRAGDVVVASHPSISYVSDDLARSLAHGLALVISDAQALDDVVG